MDDKTERTDKKTIELENQEWIDSLDYVFNTEGPDRVQDLLKKLSTRAKQYGIEAYCPGNTPYLNTIPQEKQIPYPGSREIERRIKSIIRWNAMAMVVRANRELSGIGGHISTYASAATLYEVGFNHFFKGKDHPSGGDIVYFQGHASPGIYARAYLEGRIDEKHLENFRRELKAEGGLSSYPHPWLMPEFWQNPTVSMGLAPIMAIYQARFARYLQDRGHKDTSGKRIWAFLGDGEMDEPESMGAITLASRAKLDNLTFVINCNLQRLDGPVRGNGQIIQELEAAFRGAGWNVIKVLWGDDWDELFERDEHGVVAEALENMMDGWTQKYSVEPGSFTREHFFAQDPKLLKLVENYSDEQIQKMRKGGHDPAKVYAAYKAAVETKDRPTVILAHTVKGYGMGEAGEGRNVSHQQKKLNEEELRKFRSRFGIPISDDDIAKAPFYRPSEDSEEIKYLKKRREELGGFLPQRSEDCCKIDPPDSKIFEEYIKGTGDREVATTMAFVNMLSKLLRDKNIGKNIVPIVPDEARTFGMESLFRQVGIYSHVGQVYEPVDKESLLYYKEAKDGQILEEGITEAGSMASFIAAGTAHSTHGVPLIPFYIFYSMFGFQRIGDLIWAAADAQAKGFLLGGTSGRTTLAGEGLQHQDGNSHHLAFTIPNLRAYDPAYAYELAVIIRDGIRRMYVDQENIFYYITVMNEFYPQPEMPKGKDVEKGILRGVYKFKPSESKAKKKKVHLFGSGTILNEALKAGEILEDKYGIAADVWSVTSYKNLYYDGISVERHNMLNREKPKKTILEETFEGEDGVFVAASDYLRALPNSIAKRLPGKLISLGTDGFGRSEGRAALRDFFEVDSKHIAFAAIHGLAKENRIEEKVVKKALKDLKIDPNKLDPLVS